MAVNSRLFLSTSPVLGLEPSLIHCREWRARLLSNPNWIVYCWPWRVKDRRVWGSAFVALVLCICLCALCNLLRQHQASERHEYGIPMHCWCCCSDEMLIVACGRILFQIVTSFVYHTNKTLVMRCSRHHLYRRIRWYIWRVWIILCACLPWWEATASSVVFVLLMSSDAQKHISWMCVFVLPTANAIAPLKSQIHHWNINISVNRFTVDSSVAADKPSCDVPS